MIFEKRLYLRSDRNSPDALPRPCVDSSSSVLSCSPRMPLHSTPILRTINQAGSNAKAQRPKFRQNPPTLDLSSCIYHPYPSSYIPHAMNSKHTDSLKCSKSETQPLRMFHLHPSLTLMTILASKKEGHYIDFDSSSEVNTGIIEQAIPPRYICFVPKLDSNNVLVSNANNSV